MRASESINSTSCRATARHRFAELERIFERSSEQLYTLER